MRVDVRMVKIVNRNVGPDKILIGTPHENSILNTVFCDVQFPDGSLKPYLVNIITENILDSADVDGYCSYYLDGIMGYSVSGSTASKKKYGLSTNMAIEE